MGRERERNQRAKSVSVREGDACKDLNKYAKTHSTVECLAVKIITQMKQIHLHLEFNELIADSFFSYN